MIITTMNRPTTTPTPISSFFMSASPLRDGLTYAAPRRRQRTLTVLARRTNRHNDVGGPLLATRKRGQKRDVLGHMQRIAQRVSSALSPPILPCSSSSAPPIHPAVAFVAGNA